MDFSWSELLVVGIVALIVIGPKDLPGMFRELGRFTAKLRAMGREFSRAMEQAAKETGVQDVADDLKKVANPKAMGLDAMKSAADKFEKWDPLKNAAKPTTPLPVRTEADVAAAGALASGAAAAVTESAPAKGPLTPPPMGPSTAALAEQQAARKAAAAEAAEKLRKVSAPVETASVEAAPVEAAPVAKAKAPGRVRKPAAKAAAKADGDAA